MSTLSFGIAATSDEVLVTDVAQACAELGFSKLWINDTPMADGLECARWAMQATVTLQAAVGVVAVDRRPVSSIRSLLDGIEGERLTLGIGAGFSTSPLNSVRAAHDELREEFPSLVIAIAAMGPKMSKLAGQLADVVLLNWMTPSAAGDARKLIMTTSRDRPPVVAGYVRVAAGEDAVETLVDEASRYATLPHYARHFERQGVPLAEIGIAGAGSDLRGRLAAYRDVLDETVVRALPTTPTSEALLEIARDTAP